jgi:hypothetical protein
MKWYYEENGQAVGPVSEEELADRFHAKAALINKGSNSR